MFILLAPTPAVTTDTVGRIIETAKRQAQAAAAAYGTARRVGKQTVQEVMKESQGKKPPPEIAEVARRLPTADGTESLQMKPTRKGLDVHNSLTEEIKQFDKSPEVVEGRKSKTKSIANYYGRKGPATAYITVSHGISEIVTSHYTKDKKATEAQAKKWIPKVVAALEVYEKTGTVPKEGFERFANAVGIIKGTIEGLELKGAADNKYTVRLDALVAKAEEMSKGTANQTAEEIIEQYKKAQEAPPVAGKVGPREEQALPKKRAA
ncbi:MAG: hypothetical protein HYY52_01475 [Candidatus Melainabacteria bacterium]|nr:hypothetical protein [Candidatus Melainabacteria bacterium]